VTAASDKVLKVLDADPWLLHAELQSGPRADLDEQLLWYNTLIGHRHRLPVRSVVILLRREADSPRLSGVYRRAFPGEPPYLEFRYQVVRTWQEPVEKFLNSGLGLLPLAPLADVPEAALPEVLQQMSARLGQQTTPQQEAVLWMATYVLAGLRLPPEALAPLFQGVRRMRESSAFQLIMTEGAVKELKKTLAIQVTQKFGTPIASITTALDAINDLARLERMSARIFDATSWDDLLATP
jgi:hypothetical protein